MDKGILILNGPGLTDPSGGDVTLEQIQKESETLCEELGINLDFRQTDDPEELSRWITEDSGSFDALIINPTDGPGSDDETLNTVRDLDRPVMEVHLTNVFKSDAEHVKPMRGPDGRTGFICGLGLHGYLLGIKAVAKRLQS
jgi:3-dehydroquinate dehydratase-2